MYEDPEVVLRYMLYPVTPVELLAFHEALTECAVVLVAPVPLKAIAIVAFVALLTTERDPEELTAVAGAYFT